jgi:arginine decarboxylase
VDLWELWAAARRQGLGTPLLVRFPQILETQVRRLGRAFAAARKEFRYAAGHRPVYPLKVNPVREVVEWMLAAGRDLGMGLEVASKAELYLALGSSLPEGAPLVVNGFKDETFLRMACLARRSGLDVVVVLEEPEELERLESLGALGRGQPLGLRVRPYSRGSGHWEATGGETGKFGLAWPEFLHVLRRLRELGRAGDLRMLHVHIGSQIPESRRIKALVKEASRIYAKVRHLGFPVDHLDMGGGLGVDYDGSASTADSSVNYTMEEYANDVVFHTREVCQQEGVPCPTLVTESGRALVAHHALLLVAARPRFQVGAEVAGGGGPAETGADAAAGGASTPEHPLMAELEETARVIGPKNYWEYLHDALIEREEIQSLFELGFLSLEARARAEALFREVCRKALGFAEASGDTSPEVQRLRRLLRRAYVTNFSLFRSLPDAWAVGQLFPVVPIHHLDVEPGATGVLLDLTCDSDGILRRFPHPRLAKEHLELHEPAADEPYLLAICLVGAYQEVLGSGHNRLGRPDEVHVQVEAGGEVRMEFLKRGDTLDTLCRDVHWDPQGIRERLAQRLEALTPEEKEAAGGLGDPRAWGGLGSYLES